MTAIDPEIEKRAREAQDKWRDVEVPEYVQTPLTEKANEVCKSLGDCTVKGHGTTLWIMDSYGHCKGVVWAELRPSTDGSIVADGFVANVGMFAFYRFRKFRSRKVTLSTMSRLQRPAFNHSTAIAKWASRPLPHEVFDCLIDKVASSGLWTDGMTPHFDNLYQSGIVIIRASRQGTDQVVWIEPTANDSEYITHWGPASGQGELSYQREMITLSTRDNEGDD